MNNLFVGEHSTIMINMDNVTSIETDGTAQSKFRVNLTSGLFIILSGQNTALFREFLNRKETPK